MNDIFTNQKEVVQGIRASAEAVGLDPDKVIQDTPRFEHIAKQNCRVCWGQGLVKFAPSPAKSKDMFSNHYFRNTCKSQEKSTADMAKMSYCKCVRKVEV